MRPLVVETATGTCGRPELCHDLRRMHRPHRRHVLRRMLESQTPAVPPRLLQNLPGGSRHAANLELGGNSDARRR